MEMLKLTAILAVMVLVLRLKKPLYLAVVAAIVATAVLFWMNIGLFFSTILKAAVSWSTLSVLLLFYLITYLQRMLEARGSLQLAQQSLDKLFNNRRWTASLAPTFLGLLPSASVVALCGEVVDKCVGDALPTEEKAFIASYFRHLPESILPMFSSIMISISLTQGVVTAGPFIIAMLPMVVVMAILGYVFFLRKVPKETSLPKSESKAADLKSLFRGCWPVVLIVVMILAFPVPVYIATIVAITLLVFVGKFSFGELRSFVGPAFEKNLLFSTFFILLFKDVLAATGVIAALPGIFSALPLPEVAIFSLIFFIGTIIAGSQAIAALGIPLAFLTIPNAGLPLFVLLMGLAWAANQITPTHVCLSVITSYFKISLGALAKKSVPVLAVFCAVLVAYYWLLTAVL